jgi:3-deoxy-D-manno-octulosonate cytidylyltransferase
LNRYDDTFDYDYIFFSNQKRYNEYANQIKDNTTIITTSNIDTKGIEVAQIDYTSLLEKTLDNYDNILILLLSFLSKTQFNNTIYVAGIDGYNSTHENYTHESIRLLDQNQMIQENNNLSNAINYYTAKLDIHFITPSIFHSQKQLKAIGVIPARYKSSRFEGKPLCIIDGIPMIKRTYEQAKKSLLLDKVVVATEDYRIEEYCIKENIPVIMTSNKCLTGTDRIAEVSQKEHFDLYINIQGDEPVIDPTSIDEIAKEYQKYGETYIAYNLYKTEEDYTEVNSDTIIKTIVNENDELMYMSRLPIPFNKSKTQPTYKKQVCVYGFTKKALEIFSSREKTLNELHEDIEILRFVDMGYKVKMKETTVDSIAVDVPSDVLKVEKFLNERKKKND